MKYSKINKKFIIILLIVVALGFLFWNTVNKILTRNPKLAKPEEIILQTIDDLLEKAKENISAPPPLKSEEDSAQSILIKSEVIRWTNAQRQNNGLTPLIENQKLDLSADHKVRDMFVNQYFEHQSPVGIGAGDLIKQVDYEYLIAGENLAMGNFENSEKLVAAWMESPGHRENILNSKYHEIGVAVSQGIYEGRKVWMAVQHFALPSSYCLKPDQDLKTEIDTDEQLINQIKNSLDLLRTELEAQKPKTQEEVKIYNQKVDEYNVNLDRYNLFIEQVKILINNYNVQVEVFNNCLNKIKD